ncbi:MAG: hypothetical protein AAGN82_15480 [Myxococcota bacterium]
MNAPVSELLAPISSFLGPARVVAGAPVLRVELPSGDAVPATLALAQPYRPVEGDTLLVIGRPADGYWVIGVVEGAGTTRWEVDGDLEIAATGRIAVHGARGVDLSGAAINFVARASRQTFDRLVQRVRDVLNVDAGASHVHVAGTSLQHAKKHAVIAEETASVNGKQILLG